MANSSWNLLSCDVCHPTNKFYCGRLCVYHNCHCDYTALIAGCTVLLLSSGHLSILPPVCTMVKWQLLGWLIIEWQWWVLTLTAHMHAYGLNSSSALCCSVFVRWIGRWIPAVTIWWQQRKQTLSMMLVVVGNTLLSQCICNSVLLFIVIFQVMVYVFRLSFLIRCFLLYMIFAALCILVNNAYK